MTTTDTLNPSADTGALEHAITGALWSTRWTRAHTPAQRSDLIDTLAALIAEAVPVADRGPLAEVVDAWAQLIGGPAR